MIIILVTIISIGAIIFLIFAHKRWKSKNDQTKKQVTDSMTGTSANGQNDITINDHEKESNNNFGGSEPWPGAGQLPIVLVDQDNDENNNKDDNNNNMDAPMPSRTQPVLGGEASNYYSSSTNVDRDRDRYRSNVSFNSEDLYKPGDNKYNETPIGGVENYNSGKGDNNKYNNHNYDNYRKDQNKDKKVTSTKRILFKKRTRGKVTKKTFGNIDDKSKHPLGNSVDEMPAICEDGSDDDEKVSKPNRIENKRKVGVGARVKDNKQWKKWTTKETTNWIEKVLIDVIFPNLKLMYLSKKYFQS